MKNILLVGRLDHNNYGDILMLVQVAKAIPTGYTVVVCEPCSAGREALVEAGVEYDVVRRDEVEAGAYELCIWIGGGYFAHNNFNGKKWCHSWLRDGYFVELWRALVAASIPYVIYSVEVGPITSPKVRLAVSKILQGAEEVFLRNKTSVDYAKKNLGCELCLEGPDMVLSELMAKHMIRKFEGVVGIHVTDKFNSSNFLKRLFVKQLCSYLIKNRDEISAVVLFSDNEETVSLDGAFELLVHNLGKYFDVNVHRYSRVGSLVSLLTTLDLVITTKLHVGVSSIALGSRVLCYADAPKTKRFYSQLGLLSNYSGFYLRNYMNFAGAVGSIALSWDSDCDMPVSFYSNLIKDRLEV